MRRVVITGVGAVSPLGTSAGELVAALEAGRSAVRRMGEWDGVPLRSRVAAPDDGEAQHLRGPGRERGLA
jgi:3-oxoacyl-(acyl-carrier-protein) synthase